MSEKLKNGLSEGDALSLLAKNGKLIKTKDLDNFAFPKIVHDFLISDDIRDLFERSQKPYTYIMNFWVEPSSPSALRADSR